MSKIKYVYAKNVAELEAIQAKAVKSVNSARVLVQVAAVATIRHAFEHGDWTFAGKLVTALGNTVNGKALIEWFKVYGGLKADETGFVGWSGKEHIEKNFDGAKAKMWWELKVANPFKGFDLEAALQKVIKDSIAAEKKLAELPEGERAAVKMDVNDATIKAVLKLCKFDAIIGEAPAQANDDVADAA